MSTLSSERSIVEYTMLFDQDTLCSCFDAMNFVTNDCPTYQSFHELDNLRKSLASLENAIVAKKRDMVAEAEQAQQQAKEQKEEQEQAMADKKCETGLRSAVTTQDSTSSLSNAKETSKPAARSQSISEQLGLSGCDLTDLHSSLSTDYSLEGVFTHYPYNASSAPTVFGREKDYPGFALQATDLYSRTTNSHLSMNEVCVQRFNEALTYR